MPSQSVEAATRDEAIAAAREQYGPSVPVVGVRRIRSGGVLGFFANERYVAEVDLTAVTAPAAARPGSDARAAAPEGSGSPRPRTEESLDELADLFGQSSTGRPLSLYSDAGVTRTPPLEDVVAQRRPTTLGSAGAVPAAAPVRAAPPARGAPAAAPARAAAPFSPPRYRAKPDNLADFAPDPADEDDQPAGTAPSPFTAALARMAADREVTAAVAEAVGESVGESVGQPAEQWVDEPLAAPMTGPTPLQSALQSVLRSADDRAAAALDEIDDVGDLYDLDAPDGLTARGRHRFPESAPQVEVPVVEVPVVEVPVVEGPVVDVPFDHVRAADLRVDEVMAHREPLVMTPSMAAWPSMARTASDPAPFPMDATTILPPLSLLPPQRLSQPGRPPLLRGRPAVPPPSQPAASTPTTVSRPAVTGRPAVPGAPALPDRPAAAAADERPAPTAATLSLAGSTGIETATLVRAPGPSRGLASVTRLVPLASSGMVRFGLSHDDELVVRLLALGLPEFLIGPDFTADAAARGTYAALTRSLSHRLPPVPEVPTETGDVLLVVGPGAETLSAARSLAVSIRLDPESVQWATSGSLGGLAPESSRITSLEAALERRRASQHAGTVTIIAVDAPLRSAGSSWLSHMLAVWAPVAVWAVVDSTRKLEDVAPWLDALPSLDAVVLTETDCTTDPAAVLSHVTAPVALIDGTRATAHRWASLLCERLDELDS